MKKEEFDSAKNSIIETLFVVSNSPKNAIEIIGYAYADFVAAFLDYYKDRSPDVIVSVREYVNGLNKRINEFIDSHEEV